MYTVERTYQLVNAKARDNISLLPFKTIIRDAAEMQFKDDLNSVTVHKHYFIIQVYSQQEKIAHGELVNFGKNIARTASSLSERAIRVYTNDKHPTSKQLFKCVKSSVH